MHRFYNEQTPKRSKRENVHYARNAMSMSLEPHKPCSHGCMLHNTIRALKSLEHLQLKKKDSGSSCRHAGSPLTFTPLDSELIRDSSGGGNVTISQHPWRTQMSQNPPRARSNPGPRGKEERDTGPKSQTMMMRNLKEKHLLLGPLCKTSESQGSSKALVIYSFLLVLDWRKLYRMQNVHPFPSPNDSFDSVECPTVSCLDFHVMRALFQGMSGCFR